MLNTALCGTASSLSHLQRYIRGQKFGCKSSEIFCRKIAHLQEALPAVLTALPESDAAVATGTYSFVRWFGFVWGVTLPSIAFNGQFDKYLYVACHPWVL